MPAYRIYVVTKDGHITGPPIDCADGSAAVAQAKQLLDGTDIEVWEHARLVHRLKPKDEQ